MSTKKIHINQAAIKNNMMGGGNQPVITIRVDDGEPAWYSDVQIQGKCSIVYDRKAIGATVWIETDSDVLADGKII